MRWLIAIASLIVLLLPARALATPTGDGPCAAAGDVTCWTNDYNTLTAGEQTTVSAYHTAGTTYTAILGSTYGIGYSSLTRGFREEIWDRFLEAEANDGVLATDAALANQPPDPTDTESGPPWEVVVYYSASEIQKTVGAKVAHLFWLHVNSKLPWDFSDITTAELEWLFKWNSLFHIWGGLYVSDTTADQAIIDNNPKDVYDAAVTAMGGLPYSGSQTDAWNDILLEIGRFYRHGSYTHAVTYTQSQVNKEAVSGCNSAAKLMVALMRSIMIPSRVVFGYLEGTGHSSAWFYGDVRGALVHGDDIYAAGGTGRAPIALTLDDLDWTIANVTPGAQETTVNQVQPRRAMFLGPWRMPSYDSQFCAYGWAHVRDAFYRGTTAWENAWKQEFINRTGCDGNPQ